LIKAGGKTGMKYLGKNGSGKNWSFYLTQNFLTCGSKNVVDLALFEQKM
jgi:hypothetical protein